MISDTEMTFEMALAKLEAAADALKKDSTTLEEAMNYFDEGLKQYNYCSKILADAKQKVLLYEAENNSLKEMD